MADSSAQPNGHEPAAASNGEAGQPTAAPKQDQVRRDILPIPDAKHVGLTTYDAKDPDTTYPPITALRPPKGAPNVLIVMLDDVGFGGSSAFGGPCNTPTAERLAAGGLKLNRFHTTALCSPTRQALLTGRNHHSVGMGGITEIATSAPGNSSVRPKDKAPIAETLMLNGYSTAQFGKCHEVPVWDFLGIDHFMVTAGEPIPAGKHQVRMEFKYDGGGLGKGGNVTLYCDGKPVGQGRVERTQPMIYSADEACDVGADTGSPASPDYGPTGNKFSGQIDWVQIDIGDDSQDHLIKAEDRLTIAMARQ
jgi:hypothetical protein